MIEFFMKSNILFWTVIAMGAASVFIFLARIMAFRRMRVDNFDFVPGLINVLDQENFEEALLLCDETPGCVGAVAAEALRRFRDGTEADMIRSVDAVGRAEAVRLERRIEPVSLIAQSSPVIGLLSAFLGLADTLETAAASAPVSRFALDGALSRSIIVVSASLLVMLLSQVFYGILRIRMERAVSDMETSAVQIVDCLCSKRELRQKQKERNAS